RQMKLLLRQIAAEDSENPSEYNALYEKLRDHYKPCGILEEYYTEQIATLMWRLRRVMRFETATIDKAYAGRNSNNYIDEESTNGEGINAQRPTNDSRDYLLMPDHFDSDKILRYETMLRKQLNHAMSKLEELQSSKCSDQLERAGIDS